MAEYETEENNSLSGKIEKRHRHMRRHALPTERLTSRLGTEKVYPRAAKEIFTLKNTRNKRNVDVSPERIASFWRGVAKRQRMMMKMSGVSTFPAKIAYVRIETNRAGETGVKVGFAGGGSAVDFGNTFSLFYDIRKNTPKPDRLQWMMRLLKEKGWKAIEGQNIPEELKAKLKEIARAEGIPYDVAAQQKEKEMKAAGKIAAPQEIPLNVRSGNEKPAEKTDFGYKKPRSPENQAKDNAINNLLNKMGPWTDAQKDMLEKLGISFDKSKWTNKDYRKAFSQLGMEFFGFEAWNEIRAANGYPPFSLPVYNRKVAEKQKKRAEKEAKGLVNSPKLPKIIPPPQPIAGDVRLDDLIKKGRALKKNKNLNPDDKTVFALMNLYMNIHGIEADSDGKIQSWAREHNNLDGKSKGNLFRLMGDLQSQIKADILSHEDAQKLLTQGLEDIHLGKEPKFPGRIKPVKGVEKAPEGKVTGEKGQKTDGMTVAQSLWQSAYTAEEPEKAKNFDKEIKEILARDDNDPAKQFWKAVMESGIAKAKDLGREGKELFRQLLKSHDTAGLKKLLDETRVKIASGIEKIVPDAVKTDKTDAKKETKEDKTPQQPPVEEKREDARQKGPVAGMAAALQQRQQDVDADYLKMARTRFEKVLPPKESDKLRHTFKGNGGR